LRKHVPAVIKTLHEYLQADSDDHSTQFSKMLCNGGDLMLFYFGILFFLILCGSLIAFGYYMGKSDGLMQGRRDLADYALSLGDDLK
jgi:hypothetical protein